MSEAPERIYLQDAGDYEGAAKLEVTWCVEPQDDDDTAYIRADLVEAIVKRAIEACADKCADRAVYIEDCIKWGGTKTYLTSLKGGIIELSNTGSAIRALASDPEAIAKIVSGK